jgi:hypothetical protein
MNIGFVKQLKKLKSLRISPSKSVLTRIIALIIACLPLVASGQIKIDKAGDDWDLKIDSAITLIKQVDPSYYNVLIKHCHHVEIWNGPFSTNYWSDTTGTIVVSVNDIKLNSINNLAAVLVHESCHLIFLKGGIILDEAEEERACYKYEYLFLLQVPNVEPWLLEHAFRLSHF